ncbi:MULTISPECIES: YfbR-like 5'-deoxynucleotidase [unclassified Psychrobacillus]|uniref:YfbR-like 5'-deoxynucleotidase n=1 Tax=unclassified Psychrobacillus TaxID=2636677 RepID=UPI0030FC9053
MNVIQYLLKCRGLMNLKRYQNLFLFKQRSVAEHSWSVAKIAQGLALIEREKYGKEIDMGKLLEKAISHDEIEILTGDILSLTKKRTKAMTRAVEGLERQVFEEEYAQQFLPSGWKEHFRSLTLTAKDDSIEGEILAVADVIDTMFEAIEEIQLGNTEYFSGVVTSSYDKIADSQLGSVQDILDEFRTQYESLIQKAC